MCGPLPEGWQRALKTETGREKKKRVPVYILEFRAGLNISRNVLVQLELEEMEDFIVTESEYKSDRMRAGLRRKRKEKQKGRRRYAYTIIFKQPQGAKARIMSTDEAIKAHKFLDPDNERADVGPVSFNDTVKEGRDRKARVNKYCRRFPVRTGRRGRPAVRKKLAQVCM